MGWEERKDGLERKKEWAGKKVRMGWKEKKGLERKQERMGCLKGWRGRKERFETKIGQAGKKEKKVKK